jgi:hypothetical protein
MFHDTAYNRDHVFFGFSSSSFFFGGRGGGGGGGGLKVIVSYGKEGFKMHKTSNVLES